MLFSEIYFPYFCKGYVLFSLILFLFAGHAYRVNARRPDDDPEKRDFHFGAIFLTPITWPALLASLIVITVLRAVAYSVSLFIVLAALLFVRKPFLFVWLDKFATWAGNKLLAANTALIRAFLGKPIGLAR